MGRAVWGPPRSSGLYRARSTAYPVARALTRKRSDFFLRNTEMDSYISTEGIAPASAHWRNYQNMEGKEMSERKREPTGDYLDARSFGELLDLNRESIYRAVSRGELQAIRIGRTIRLPRKQLESLLIGEGRDDAHGER